MLEFFLCLLSKACKCGLIAGVGVVFGLNRGALHWMAGPIDIAWQKS